MNRKEIERINIQIANYIHNIPCFRMSVLQEVGLCVEDGTITSCEVYSDALYPDLIQAFADTLTGLNPKP